MRGRGDVPSGQPVQVQSGPAFGAKSFRMRIGKPFDLEAALLRGGGDGSTHGADKPQLELV